MLSPSRAGLQVSVLLAVLFMTPLAAAQYNTFGTFVLADHTDASSIPNVSTPSAAFSWNDANTDCQIQNTERIYLDLNNDLDVDIGDVRIANPVTGSAMGSVASGATDLTNALKTQIGATAPACTVGGTALGTFFMRKAFVSTARSSTSGFTVTGYGAYLDIDANNRVTENDIRLAAPSQTAGTFVAAAATDLDPATLGTTEYSANLDCIYLSADAVVGAGDTRIGRCGEYLEATTLDCTGVLDADCGQVLFTIATAKTGTVSALTEYFDDLDTAASNVVSNGDRRLSPIDATRIEGTLVTCTGAVDPKITAGDTDCGTALSAAANVRFSRRTYDLAAPAILAFDTNDDGAIPEGVVIDINGDGSLSPGDLRAVGGTYVTVTDIDVVLELVPFTVAPIYLYQGAISAPTAVALDLDADSVLDPEDVVLFATSCTSGTLRRSTVAGQPCNPSGAWTSAGEAIAATKYRESGGGAAFGAGDTLYITLEPADTTVDTDDVRLTAFSSGTPGSLVGAGLAGESGAALVAASTLAGTQAIGFVDLDETNSVTPGDLPVIDLDGDGYLSYRDVPLVTVGAVPFGTIAAAGTSALVHALVAIGTHNQGTGSTWSVKYLDNDGSGGPSVNDPVYLEVASPLTRFRLSANAAGAAAGLPATTETGAVLTSLTATGVCTNPIAYQEVAGAGLSSEDDVYVDVAVGGCGTVSTGDIYLKKSGKASGLKVGGSDTQGATLTALTTTALAYFDLDSTASLTSGDLLFLDLDSGTGLNRVSLFDFRMSGASGTTTLGSVVPPPPPPAPPAPTTTATTTATSTSTVSTTSTSTSTSSESSTDSSSQSDSGTQAPASLASINLRLQSSLEVDREDGKNVLKWDTQSGVTGYQIWSSDSPYVLLATLDNSAAASFTDINGDKDTKYLVTAYQASPLTAADVNDGNIPGYSGVPEGEDAGAAGSKSWVPGPGLLLVALALVAAGLVARRRL